MTSTDNITAETLARIETENGKWWAYGNDGRLTVEANDNPGEWEGEGYRARFIDNPHGGDYGWGPLGTTEAEAISLYLDEQAELGIDE